MNSGSSFVYLLLILLGMFFGFAAAIAGVVLVVLGARGGLLMDSDDEVHKPSWYKDPYGVYSHLAYWDGTEWTGEMRQQPLAPRRKMVGTGLVVLVFGLLLGVASYGAFSNFLCPLCSS